jgi:nickel transport protein
MRRSCPASLSVAPVFLAVALGWTCPEPANAHKVVVFATCTGKTIDGEVYFQGGAAARNVRVTLVGPEDQVLGETTTDDEGRFTFPVRFRCDHKLLADAGEGHAAEYTVPADELPDGLPPLGGSEPAVGAGPEETESTAVPDNDAKRPAPPGGSDREPVSPAPHGEAAHQRPVAPPDQPDLRAEIRAIGKQLAALRSDLDRYNNELHLRDVLGGLGYIVGIMGVVFYFLGVRRKEKRSAGTDSPGA